MQGPSSTDQKRKRDFKPSTVPACAGFRHLEGDISVKDEFLGLRNGATRADFEKYQTHWRKQFGAHLPDSKRGEALVPALIDALARRWAAEPLDAVEEWDALPAGALFSPAIVAALLKRTNDYCGPGDMIQRNKGAESIYLPFQLWATMALRLDGRDAVASTYRGLVLGDTQEFNELMDVNNHAPGQMNDFDRQKEARQGDSSLTITVSDPLSPVFLVVLDLSGTNFGDIDAKQLHLAVGPMLAALRLDRTLVTEVGLASLARSVPRSKEDQPHFLWLQYISLKGLKVGDNAGVKALTRFPALAAIDVRGTSVTGIEFFRPAINDLRRANEGQTLPYHQAHGKELDVFAPNLSLASAYRRLRALVETPKEASASVPALVHVRETCRRDQYDLPSDSIDQPSRSIFTPSLGHVYSTTSLCRQSLMQDHEEVRGGRAAFEVGSGSLVMATKPLSGFAAPSRELTTEVSDSEDAVTNPRKVDCDARQTVRSTIQAVAGQQQLLFRKISLDYTNSLVMGRGTKPALAGMTSLLSKPLPGKASLEPAVARKKKGTSSASVIGFEELSRRLAPPSSALPKPLSSMGINSSSSRTQDLKRPAELHSFPPSGSKAARGRLSAFRKHEDSRRFVT